MWRRPVWRAWGSAPPELLPRPGKETHLLHHFILKLTILPRQARDKHRENAKGDAFSFLQGTNGGLRWKSSGSTIENNIISRAGNSSSTWKGKASTGVEVSALQDWMEGPMAIDDVRIVGNRWEECGLKNNPVTVMPEATNVSQINNTWN